MLREAFKANGFVSQRESVGRRQDWQYIGRGQSAQGLRQGDAAVAQSSTRSRIQSGAESHVSWPTLFGAQTVRDSSPTKREAAAEESKLEGGTGQTKDAWKAVGGSDSTNTKPKRDRGSRVKHAGRVQADGTKGLMAA